MTTVPLQGPDRERVALEAGRSVKTVARVYSGAGNPYSRDAVIRAAQKLGLPLPPAPMGRMVGADRGRE